MTHDSSGGTPRQIPSIEQLRQRAAMLVLEEEFGRGQVVTALRVEADALRARLAQGEAEPDVTGAIERAVADRLRTEQRPSLRTVINATGVILHTNLGRAPLGDGAVEAVRRIMSSVLEPGVRHRCRHAGPA